MRNSDAVVETRSATPTRIALGGILLLFAAMSAVGITWGLPSRQIDKYLFGDGEVWSGEKIYRLAKADRKFSPTRGADVDVDPVRKGGDEPIPLTATEEDVAKIYLRYRLYTYQPDEMITMMALAGMRPSKLDFDPRLYQYGGLFIYPVGALIKLCGLLGLIDVRSDVVFYLDNPDEFGKFYIVARAYSAAWGLIGVIIVFAVAKRIATHRAGLMAALLFTLMPVVVCMAHEGKPHLPGAVLMLLAVYFAMRCAQWGSANTEDQKSQIGDRKSEAAIGIRQSTIGNRQFFWWMCVCCGASLGTVLSSWPIFALIPLVAFRAAGFSPRGLSKLCAALRPRTGATLLRTIGGFALALGIYFVTNPYVLINAFVNREVLKSNFGNSLAMYEIARFGAGFIRVVELTIEGATLPVLLLGLFGLVLVVVRKQTVSMPLIVVAAMFFLQFVFIGAGKPAEYGRFGIFTDTALIVGAATILAFRVHSQLINSGVRLVALAAIVWTMLAGSVYLRSFVMDARDAGTRHELAEIFRQQVSSKRCKNVVVGVPQEPAPYCLSPMHFAKVRLFLADGKDRLRGIPGDCRYFAEPCQLEGLTLSGLLQPGWNTFNVFRANTPISWANKPLILWPIDADAFGD